MDISKHKEHVYVISWINYGCSGSIVGEEAPDAEHEGSSVGFLGVLAHKAD